MNPEILHLQLLFYQAVIKSLYRWQFYKHFKLFATFKNVAQKTEDNFGELLFDTDYTCHD